MNVIESNLIKQINNKKIMIKTDCSGAKQILESTNGRIFKQDIELYNKIKETYRKRIIAETQQFDKDPYNISSSDLSELFHGLCDTHKMVYHTIQTVLRKSAFWQSSLYLHCGFPF